MEIGVNISILIVLIIFFIMELIKGSKIKTDPKKDFNDRFEFTDNIFKLIDNLITREIERKLKSLLYLQKKYELIKLDTDVDDIATEVYSALDKNYIISGYCLITSEYIMKYIISRANTLFLDTVLSYNKALDEEIRPDSNG